MSRSIAKKVSLLTIADLVRGVSYKRDEARAEAGPGFLPILRANNIQEGHLVLDDLVFVPRSRVSSAQRIRQGDIVLAMSSGSRDVVGKAALATSDWEGGFGAFCGVLRAKPGTRPDWLAHFLRSPAYREAIDAVATGTNINNLSKSTLAAIQLPAADEDVQERVGRLLDAMNTSRSSCVAHIRAGRRAIERFHQAVLVAACSGRLTADWRGAHVPPESSEELLERSRRLVAASAGRKRETESWSEPKWLDIPNSWRWAPLRELAAIRGGIQKQPKRAPRKNAYPYLRVANVLRGRLDLSEVHQFELFKGELDTYRLEPGDLLVVEGNGSSTEIGRSALWNGEIPNCVHQNHIIRVRCALMEPRFVDLFWNSPIAAREIAALAVTSSGLYSLSTKKIGSVPVAVVPLEEQREIIRRADQLLSIGDSLTARVDSAARQVDRSSQAVLAKAFRGGRIGTRT